MYNLSPKARFVSSVGNGLFNSASLDLPFAKTKSLVDATTGQNLVTFTRASSGTYVDSQGVIRTATTNLLLRSEEFDNAVWALNAAGTGIAPVLTANYATAPNGTLTAYRLQANRGAGNTSSDASNIVQAVSGLSDPHTVTISIWAKSNTGNSQSVYFRNNTGVGGSVIVVTTNWQRFSITGSRSGSTNNNIQIGSRGANNTDNSVDILIWGAQLEQSSTVGEYIPTTSTINSAPRFDHSPTTGESLGLLVEEQRTNLVTWSQDFSQADWSKNASTIVTTAVASPIQGVNYQKIEATSANTTVGITSVAVTAATQQRAVSFFAQPLGNISRVLVVVQGADARINVNLVDGTFTTNAAASGSTVSVSGQRFSVSTPTLTNATGVRFFLKRTGETDTNTPTTIAIGEGLYLIGAQMEAGSFPTSYIPTTTAAVTRSADVASITGSNFSSWYRQDEGTVFSEYFPNAVAPATSGQMLFHISNNSSTDRTYLAKRANADQSTRWASNKTGATDVSFINAGTWLAANSKIATTYRINDFAASLNGATSITDTTVDLFTAMTQINIGSDHIGAAPLNGTIRRLTYFPTRLSNETLQRITQ